MKIINRFKTLSFLLITAYLLAACGGTIPESTASTNGPKVEANMVTLTGIVEAINGTQWTVGGQTLTLDPQVSLDPNIAVGDQVRVEANVSANGTVTALKVESPVADDVVSTPSADPSVNSTSDPSATQTPGNAQNEVFGTVEAITSDTITVNGVTYNLANFTEIKDALAVGDQVKVHMIVNADGTVTVLEIEKSAVATVDDSSSNSNSSDDGPNHDVNDDHSSSSGASTNDSTNHDLNNDNSSSSGHSSDDGANHDSNDDNGGGNSGSGGD